MVERRKKKEAVTVKYKIKDILVIPVFGRLGQDHHQLKVSQTTYQDPFFLFSIFKKIVLVTLDACM